MSKSRPSSTAIYSESFIGQAFDFLGGVGGGGMGDLAEVRIVFAQTSGDKIFFPDL